MFHLIKILHNVNADNTNGMIKKQLHQIFGKTKNDFIWLDLIFCQ